MHTKTIFDHPIYGPILARGVVDGYESIPDDLAEAMGILLSRSVGVHVDFRDCKEVAALVVLACGKTAGAAWP